MLETNKEAGGVACVLLILPWGGFTANTLWLVLIRIAHWLHSGINQRSTSSLAHPSVKTPDNISSRTLSLGPGNSLFMIYSKLHYLSAGFNYTPP